MTRRNPPAVRCADCRDHTPRAELRDGLCSFCWTWRAGVQAARDGQPFTGSSGWHVL